MPIRLYIAQRLTAALMVPLIIGHLIVMFYATRTGLTAADILGRTRGSLLWGAYYGVFVAAASIHGAIGLRTVAAEWLSVRAPALNWLMWSVGVLLALLGFRAVVAVVLAP
jgi:fumarate reductase subunit C